MLDWLGPYWAGVASAFGLMFAVEMTLAWRRSRSTADAAVVQSTARATPEIPASTPVAGLYAHFAIRRLNKRADSLELVALTRSVHRAYVLSHWRPDGTDQERIRLDAIHVDGLPDVEFGQGTVGFTSFTLPGGRRAQAQRLTVLTDGGVLVVGSSFDDRTRTSTGFLAKIDASGSLDANFGASGIVIFPGSNVLSYAQDAVQIDGYIFCVGCEFESSILKVFKFTTTGKFVDVKEVVISDKGMVWPSRIRRTFPEGGFLVIGRTTSSEPATMDGFIAKLDSSAALVGDFGQHGIVVLGQAFALPTVHQVLDLAVLPTGSTLVAGTGNEGFIVGLDPTGKPLASFGRFGLYEAQATYRTTATSFSYSSGLDAICLGGTESDGNSINRPFLTLLDTKGQKLLPDDADPVVVALDAPSYRTEHLLLENGCVLAVMQEGPLSLGRRGVSIGILPAMEKSVRRNY